MNEAKLVGKNEAQSSQTGIMERKTMLVGVESMLLLAYYLLFMWKASFPFDHVIKGLQFNVCYLECTNNCF